MTEQQRLAMERWRRALEEIMHSYPLPEEIREIAVDALGPVCSVCRRRHRLEVLHPCE